MIYRHVKTRKNKKHKLKFVKPIKKKKTMKIVEPMKIIEPMKIVEPTIHGYIISEKEGWKVLHVYGNAHDRGYAHGTLLHAELAKIPEILAFNVKTILRVPEYSDYKSKAQQIHEIVKTGFPEFYTELEGISAGAKTKGVYISVETLIEWNSVLSLYDAFSHSVPPVHRGRCSAFIACGDATTSGKIVMAHNTHCDYVTSKTQNVIMYITPEQGMTFVMQTAAGMLASTTDWFICTSGIMGCETTISKMKRPPVFGDPYFCRIRRAMQYGRSLDEYVEIMLKNNAGDYACSWLLGNFNLNEIMLFDIGSKTHHIERTKNGVYYGMNTALNAKFRKTETNDMALDDLTTSSGARNARLLDLLNTEYYGKIDVNVGQRIIADHYDVNTKSHVKNKHSICKHSELDASNVHGKAHYPWGCTDGKVVDTSMAKQLAFMSRFGSSCGTAFNAKSFLEKHGEYKEDWEELMEDHPSYKWTKIVPISK